LQPRSKGKKTLPKGLYVRKRNGKNYWLVQVTIDGKKIARGIGYVSRQDALRQYPEILSALQNGVGRQSPGDHPPFARFLENEYLPMLENCGLSDKTVQCERDNSKKLIEYFGRDRSLDCCVSRPRSQSARS